MKIDKVAVLEILLWIIIIFVALKAVGVIDPPLEEIQLWQTMLPQLGAAAIIFYALKSEMNSLRSEFHQMMRELESKLGDKFYNHGERLVKLESKQKAAL